VLALLAFLGVHAVRHKPDDVTVSPASSAVCVKAQRDAFSGLVSAWRQFAAEMGPTQSSAAESVIQPWTSALGAVRARVVAAGCPDPPQELAPIVDFTSDLGRDSEVTPAEAQQLGGLLRDMARAVQVSSLDFDERLLNLPTTCAKVDELVSVRYSSRSLNTSSGKDVWAVLSVRNRSSRTLYVAAEGQLDASRPAAGQPSRMAWQSGSSVSPAPPFKTSQLPLLGPGGERLHLMSGGRPTSLAIKVHVGFTADLVECAVPAQRSSEAVTVAAAGDIACDPKTNVESHHRCHQKVTAGLVEQIHPDAVFALGDLQYQAGSLANFHASYDRSWGRFKKITYPVLGNHEYGSPGASGYFAYFGDRATPQDPECVDNCRGYYSFDLGAWHVVALNVICDKLPDGDGCSADSRQNRWLQRDLQAARETTGCTVVLMHEPRWSSSDWELPKLDPLIRTMYRNGVDLVLSGSSHAYERFAPQTPDGRLDKSHGLTQMVIGTGGAHFTNLHSPDANSVTEKQHVFGVLDLSLRNGSWGWDYRSDPSTPFSDSGSQTCH
jgi:hypothetical protein